MSEQVNVIVVMRAVEGKTQALGEALRQFVAETRKEPGCESFVLNQSTEDERTFVVTETWSDRVALEGHLKGPVAATMRDSGALEWLAEHQHFDIRRVL